MKRIPEELVSSYESRIAKEEFLGYFFQNSSIYQRFITFGFLMKIIGGNLKPGDDALDAQYFPINKLPEIPFISHNKFITIIKKKFDL